MEGKQDQQTRSKRSDELIFLFVIEMVYNSIIHSILMLIDIQRISEIYNQFIHTALQQRTPILILASPDVDALASARMLTVLIDSISYNHS